MIWLAVVVAFIVFFIIFGLKEDELFLSCFFGLVYGGFVFLALNGIFAGVMGQHREYEITKLQAIDDKGSLVEINDSECVYNAGSGINTVGIAKCEIVESPRGEIKTTHYSPNYLWTVFTWSDYNRFYVTRDQVSYGG